MMIAPDAYYELELTDHSKTQVLKKKSDLAKVR